MKAPRLHCPLPLATGNELALPRGAARHVQVLRLQPGDALELFHGGLPQHYAALPPATGAASGQTQGWFEAHILQIGRSHVTVRIGAHHAEAETSALAIHLAVAVPAGDRMDWLVEKATELGAASIQPLMTTRSVLRLKGERADKKVAHWQAVAVAACEQSGRTRVPLLHAVQDLPRWLPALAATGTTTQRYCLSLQPQALALRQTAALLPGQSAWLLSGSEGGLDTAEEALAAQHGFAPVSLGPHILRADTAPLAALACLMLR